MKKSLLEQSILSTVCYFDVFDYPLTLVDIFKWLKLPDKTVVKLSEVIFILEDSKYLRDRIEFKGGYYFLTGRDELVEMRMKRYDLAEPKFNIAIRIIRILSYFPSIRMISICNTLAYSNARKESDIDLFFIVRAGKIWQTRLVVTGLLQLFRLRPSKGDTEDKICSTFFISDDNLDIKNISISDNDYYFIYWLTQIFPVYDDGVYDLFLKNNNWKDGYLPNNWNVSPSYYRSVKVFNSLKSFLKIFFLFFPDWLAKNIQLKIMPTDLKQMANYDTRVIVSDRMLKFHKTDRRKYYNNKFEETLKRLS